MTVFYKTLSVPMTAEDVEKNTILTEEEKAVIGQVYLDKEVFNAECNRRLKDAKKALAFYVDIVATGSHEVPCRVEVDYQENRARIFREDTGQFVRSRAIEDDEKQSGMPWSASPAPVTITESAKAKQPGLSAMPEDVPAPTNAPLVDSVELAVSPELRARIVEEVGEEYVAIVLENLRDGHEAAPAIAIARGMREKAEKDAAAPAEKPKKKGKAAKEKAPPRPSFLSPEDEAVLLAEYGDEVGGWAASIVNATFTIGQAHDFAREVRDILDATSPDVLAGLQEDERKWFAHARRSVSEAGALAGIAATREANAANAKMAKDEAARKRAAKKAEAKVFPLDADEPSLEVLAEQHDDDAAEEA